MSLFNRARTITYTSVTGDKVYPVIVDIKKGISSSEQITFVSSDINTGILSVAFVNGEKDYNVSGAEVVCTILRPDSTTLDISCDIVGSNIIEVPLGVNGTSLDGIYSFDFKIFMSGSRVVGTPIMGYSVSLSIDNEDILTEDDRIPVLTTLITKVTNVKAQAESVISEGKSVITQARQATSNAQTATKNAEDVIASVKNAISSGTVDLELKQLRTALDGTVYATANDRLNAIEKQPYILFEEVIG